MSSLLTATVPQQAGLIDADDFIPTQDDWAEFLAFCDEHDAAEADLAQLPEVEPSAESWAVHVADYLTAHNLAAVPF